MLKNTDSLFYKLKLISSNLKQLRKWKLRQENFAMITTGNVPRKISHTSFNWPVSKTPFNVSGNIRESWIFSREVYVAYTFLGIISSALNAIIYGVLNNNFKKEYLKVLPCRYCRSQTIVALLEVAGRGDAVPMDRSNQVERTG